ncbi:MAG: hypothetical protein QOK23_4270 [Gammaproteobacteria bacterium]|jgi:hypothetical protein|nr:hypothetical protein [Gammaproteobacteria bacterium]
MFRRARRVAGGCRSLAVLAGIIECLQHILFGQILLHASIGLGCRGRGHLDGLCGRRRHDIYGFAGGLLTFLIPSLIAIFLVDGAAAGKIGNQGRDCRHASAGQGQTFLQWKLGYSLLELITAKIKPPKHPNGVRLGAMNSPTSLQAAARRTLFSRLIQASDQLETASKLALLCVFIGWFMTDTLVVTLGSLQHGVRFFDMSAVIADPTRLFFGIQGSFQRILFGLVCILSLSAAALPYLRRERAAWLAYLAPLVLMLICGVLLYSRTSSEFFGSPTDASVVGSDLIRFANKFARQGSGLVARHISMGVGGYLAFVASLVLALRGIRHYRHPQPPLSNQP